MTTANLEGIFTPVEHNPDLGTKRALVIAAHPDDADFGAAGTAHLWTKQGSRTTITSSVLTAPRVATTSR